MTDKHERKDYPPYLDCPRPRVPMTNGDKIRAMTDEELAWELMTWRIETSFKLNGTQSNYPDTQEKILDWLKQEATE